MLKVQSTKGCRNSSPANIEIGRKAALNFYFASFVEHTYVSLLKVN